MAKTQRKRQRRRSNSNREPNERRKGKQLDAAREKKSIKRSDRSVNDDIESQLRRQRQKSKAKTAVTAGSPQNADSPPTDTKAARTDKLNAAKYEGAGDFQYDPILGRYFPKSAFKSDGSNDVCIQRIQKRILTDQRAANSNGIEWIPIIEQPFHTKECVRDDDVRKVIFRGRRLPTKNTTREKRKKQRNNPHRPYQTEDRSPSIPCSERTIFLLTTSLEYCTMSQRRNAIASMLGPVSVAAKAKVVPNRSTLETIKNETTKCMQSYFDTEEWACERACNKPPRPFASTMQSQQSWEDSSPQTQKWFSMLHPLKPPRETAIRNQLPPWSPALPHDCKCKSHLHPTAPTFDVIPPGDSDWCHDAMPYIATISNDAVYYRTPCREDGNSAWELESLPKSLLIHGIRFAPCWFGDETQGESVVGCLTHNLENDERNFTLQETGSIGDKRSSELETYALASPVNDFCFTPSPTSQAMVAFAHGGDADVGASFLDISSGSYFSMRKWSHSEPLCLRFRKDNQKVLFGHRDGCVSMIDTRSARDALFATSLNQPAVSFGSATFIQSLQKNDHLVAVKGSFGSCRIFDLRRLRNNKVNNDFSSRHQRSTLLELSIPNSMVHQTNSTKCTGLALDPTESIAIAPFANADAGDSFAVWDIATGALLRTLNLDRLGKHTGSAFCELSSVTTSGYEMICNNDSDTPQITCQGSSFGLWFKTSVGNAPPDGGGINHISF